ncbi:MAG TPA: hypothetical protein VF765_34160 [Polyangiaceae bacterium]
MRPGRRLAAWTTFLLLGACSSSGDSGSPGTTDAGADATDAAMPDAMMPPKDAGSTMDASRDAGGDSGKADATSPCMPLRHFTFTSTAVVPLGCDANAPATILDVPVPATGRALGRATFSVQHTGANSVTHFWNVQVHVGSAKDPYGLGDDVCPGTTSARENLGFGVLSAQAGSASVVGYSGAAPCTPGTLQVLAGATLEIWVEDPAPACAGGDLAFASYYDAEGFTTEYDWTTSFTQLPGVTASLATTGASETMRVLGVVEGSPHLDPNTTCGSEVSTIDLETALDGQPMEYVREVVPASQGMGHRVLFTSGDTNELRAVTPGMHAASLLVASDFVVSGQPVTTGGCCGDGEVALLRMR